MDITTWEHELEPRGDDLSISDFHNKFTIRGELGWEYAGPATDSAGVEYWVWKRLKR